MKALIKILTRIIPSLLVLMIGCCHSNANDEVTGSSGCHDDCRCQSKEGSTVSSKERARFGIDVSHHNGDIDWAKLKDAEDLLFVYVKATEGATHVDRNFKANAKGAAEAGYLTGSYHFFRMTSSAHAQFENFLRAIGSVGKPGTYTIWQYSEKGNLQGIPKPVDLAKFHPSHSIDDIKMPNLSL